MGRNAALSHQRERGLIELVAVVELHLKGCVGPPVWLVVEVVQEPVHLLRRVGAVTLRRPVVVEAYLAGHQAALAIRYSSTALAGLSVNPVPTLRGPEGRVGAMLASAIHGHRVLFRCRAFPCIRVLMWRSKPQRSQTSRPSMCGAGIATPRAASPAMRTSAHHAALQLGARRTGRAGGLGMAACRSDMIATLVASIRSSSCLTILLSLRW